MSIHVRLSAEAEDKLHREKRNSTIASVLFSVLVIAAIFGVLGLIALKVMPKENPDFDITYSPPVGPPEPPKPPTLKTARSKPSAPADRPNKVLVSNTVSNISIPTVDVDVTSPSVDISDHGFSMGDIGDVGVIGTGPGFKNIIGVFGKRCSKEDRMDRLSQMGGRVEAEEAVEKGLEWLKATQSEDGSWSNKHTSAMTGFGLLAYLGRCETPASAKYGDSCLRAITFLVDLGVKNDGKLSKNTNDKHWSYEHAIATYALCEAVTFCQKLNIVIPDLQAVTQKAVGFIIDHQHEKTGGWDYAYDIKGNRGGDLSIAAWHIQALKAASHMGIEIKGLKNAQKKAMVYVESLQGENGGFGYTSKPGGNTYAKLTGAGVLCLQMSDRKHDASIRKGAKHILGFSKFDYGGEDSNLYAHYYESQAMMARGGSEWRKYNEMFRDQLIHSQNSDGSWKVPGSGGHYTDIHYRTCLNILMLEVYYRFLPGTGSL